MSNETKKTAVDIFIERLRYLGYLNNENYDTPQVFQEIIKAKEMEKEQIIEFGELVWKNLLRSDKIMKSRDVYNETYGGNK